VIIKSPAGEFPITIERFEVENDDLALRYAERFKPDNQGLAEFIKSKGGINECAARRSDRIR
jgi:hypothetical protein